MTTLKERIAGIVDKNLREAGAIYEHNTEETTKEILSVIREDVAGLIGALQSVQKQCHGKDWNTVIGIHRTAEEALSNLPEELK